jgi:hypothetical protein
VSFYAYDIQDAAVAVLRSQATLAGDNVEADRIDPLPAGGAPHIIVYAGTEATPFSTAGGPPAFVQRCTMVVQCLVSRADKDTARADVNAMIAQVHLALLEDPVWTRMPAIVESMRVTRTFTGSTGLVEADGRIEFVLTWREDYQVRVATPLNLLMLRVDTAQPFDPSGSYQPDYPVAAPPRVVGPDGRIEIGAQIPLPQ